MDKHVASAPGDQNDFSGIVLDTIDALVAVLDRQGRILSFNRACVETTGFSFQEVRGRHVWDMLVPAEQVDEVRSVFSQLSAGQFPNKYENYWLTRSGERRLIAWSNNCALDANGEVEFVIPTGIDITDHQQAIDDLKHSEEQKHLLLNSTAEAIYGVSVDGVCEFVNDACLKMLGYEKPADLVGKNMHALIHHTYPDGRPYPKESCHVRLSTLKGEMTHIEDEVHWRSDGTSFPVEYWSRPIFKNNNLVGAVVTFIDISERKKVEEQLLKLSSAIEQTADAISITDARGVIEYVNPAFENITGYSSGQIIGKKPDILKSGEHGDEFYRRVWKELTAGRVFNDVFVNKRNDGSMYYEEKTITPILNSENEITHFISTSRDITGRVETEKQLHHIAHHDVLTDLPNRVLFLDRLKQALARARWHGRTVAVLFLDVDRFKNINDTLGHESGDMLLRQFSRRLTSCLRERDTIARFGGDEFVILLDDIARMSDVEVLAQKILDKLVSPIVVNDNKLHVTASIGISLFPEDGEDSSTLLRHADLAMYRAKDDGRNSYEFYSSEMTAHAFERLNLENSLRQALEQQQYVIFYQPQINVLTGSVVGVEALLRWRHPELGLVTPDSFIPVLEETGLIVPVGGWVLHTACEQLARWRQQGFTSLKLSVNLSNRQFCSADLGTVIKSVLAKNKIPHELLELEITESMMMSNEPLASALFEELVALGVQLSIDDFGTGYSSLSYLTKLSIDTLKIDRSFIVDVLSNEDDAAIAEAIVRLGQSLRLNLVAEGVETEQQLRFLESIDCHVMQGYLFCRPVPAEDIPDFILSQPRVAE
jgi:diguanylate cyclase (GGDEF)-like protein/PAS domain S-box-containing protein